MIITSPNAFKSVPKISDPDSLGALQTDAYMGAVARGCREPDPLLMSIIEQLFPLRRGLFFNSDCEKADGKTS